MTPRRAVQSIEKWGMCLVFPIDNQRHPPSLWYEFFPKSKMRWEWDESGDNRVAELWHLREELSRSGKVVYAKWYRGRATFFSKFVFTRLLSLFQTTSPVQSALSAKARELLVILEENSPLSTKALKREAGLQGAMFEREYESALKELWRRFLVVGYGEVDDGAFPSLAIGSTHVLFESLWSESAALDRDKSLQELRPFLLQNELFGKQLIRQDRSLAAGLSPGPSKSRRGNADSRSRSSDRA